MRPIAGIAALGVLCSGFVGAAVGQDIVRGADLADAVQVLDAAPSKEALPCSIEIDGKAFLDFAFRYNAEFLVQCRLGGVVQPGSTLFAVIRMTPRINTLGIGHPGATPTILMEQFNLPVPAATKPSPLLAPVTNQRATMGGGYSIGPGKYLVEVALTDRHGHTCRARRTLKTVELKSARDVPFALQPGAVAPLLDSHWNGALAGKGLRLTVFLNAYNVVSRPLASHRVNPLEPLASLPGYGGLARVYHRNPEYLLDSLASVLKLIPCQSVNVVAFNLDNQELLFRQKDFDSGGFRRLEKALGEMQTGSIRYQALRRGAWADFLVHLTQSEAAPAQSSDVFLFLGPWGSHEWDKFPKPLTREIEQSRARVFYFRYFPLVGHAPDGMDRWIKQLHGSVFDVRSPEMLAHSIQTLRARTSVSAAN